VFEEFSGIPMHPLVVHGAVVFLPLQVLAAIAYAVVPWTRRQIAWLVAGLAVIGPIAAFVARASGQALRDRKVERAGDLPLDLTKINEHSDFADATFYASLALGVLTLLLLGLHRAGIGQSRAGDGGARTGDGQVRAGTVALVLNIVMAAAVVGVGGATAYYILRTGDSGARMTWEGQ
jgi:hypothetical protein